MRPDLALPRAIGRLWVPLLAVLLPVATGMLLLARNHLATGGQVSPPLDDTFIYFQYARTFAGGDLFAWIPGGGYSTGATSMVYVPLLALGWVLGATGPWLYAVAWGMGLLCGVAGLWILGRWIERELGTWEAAGGLLCAGGSGVVLWNLHSGMDGALLFLALTAAAAAVDRHLRAGRPGPWGLASFLAVMPLVRPEAGVLALFLGALAVGRPWRRRRVLILVGAPLLALLALAALNLALTGSAATNGVITKSWMSDPTLTLGERLFAVLREAGTFLSRFAWPGEVAPERALLAPLFLAGAWIFARRGRRGWILAALAVLGIGLTLQSSYANVHRNRYQAPFLAMAYALAGAAAVGLLRGAGAWIAARARGGGEGVLRRLPAAAGSLGVVALLLMGLRDVEAWSWRFALDARDILRHPVAAGAWVATNVKEDEVVAVHDAGAMPYVSGHARFLDIVGLGSNGFGRWYRSGPGSLFERIESLPPGDRPSYYAVYADWFEDVDLLGPAVHRIALRRTSIVPNPVLHIFRARGDRFDSGHRPWRTDVAPGDVIDAVDLADLDSEAAHDFDAGPRPGPTRYLRGPTGAGAQGGDGARWVRGETLFWLGVGPRRDARELRLGLRLAADRPVKVIIRPAGWDTVTVDLPGDAVLRDVLVPAPVQAGDERLLVGVAPSPGQSFFLARAYVVTAPSPRAGGPRRGPRTTVEPDPSPGTAPPTPRR